MSKRDIAEEILGLYRKHGWELRRILLKLDEAHQLEPNIIFPGVQVIDSSIDAMWFSRPSHGGEAWELRLISEQPFALFEKFEKDENEEQRDEVRDEMEAKMRDYVRKPSPS